MHLTYEYVFETPNTKQFKGRTFTPGSKFLGITFRKGDED